jgi:RNA polymerase sigma-70 factor, ECF subfamily
MWESLSMKVTAFRRRKKFEPNSDSSCGKAPGEVFEELAMPLLNPLYNFACWLTRNREEAEDLVQETYLKAYQGFSSFRLGTNFRAWIYRILHNTFLSSRAGLQVTMTVSLDAKQENGPERVTTTETPESIVIKIANQDLVRSAIEELPLDFREILLLREVEEMSYREIAAALSLPIGTVMSRLSRARQAVCDRLRNALQAHPAPAA